MRGSEDLSCNEAGYTEPIKGVENIRRYFHDMLRTEGWIENAAFTIMDCQPIPTKFLKPNTFLYHLSVTGYYVYRGGNKWPAHFSQNVILDITFNFQDENPMYNAKIKIITDQMRYILGDKTNTNKDNNIVSTNNNVTNNDNNMSGRIVFDENFTQWSP